MLEIQNNEELIEIVKILEKQEVIGIDTEFVRVETYFANLALVQIATKSETYIIDPLKADVKLLSKVLEDNKIVKIFHAPSQDLAIFYHRYNILVKNIFDVQTAAQLCGIKYQISYQRICQQILNVHIDKTQQFQDWLVRPLSQEMLKYAAEDVKHLIGLHNFLSKQLQAYHDYNFAMLKMAELGNKENYLPNFESLWEKIKFKNKAPEYIEKIKMLSAFREQAAIDLNLPRKHVISDEDIVKIADNLPKSLNDLAILRVKSRFTKDQKQELVDLCVGLNEGLK